MEDENYTKLIEFLGKKFDKSDDRFENLEKQIEVIRSTFATKDDLKSSIQDVIHQTGILHEETQHKLDLIVEGMQTQVESRGRDKDELLKAIGRLEKNDMLLHADITDHERRITQLEKKA